MADMVTALEVFYEVLKNDPVRKTSGQVFMVNAPDDVTGLCLEINQADAPPYLTMGVGTALDMQIVEVGVRGLSRAYAAPRDEALRVRKVMQEMSDKVVAGVRLVSVIPLGYVTPHGRDKDNREMFTVRFSVLTEPI